MFIMTQDDKKIINFNSFSSVFLSERNNKYCISARINENKTNELCLGKYEYEIEAEFILCKIARLIKNGNNFYEMPEYDKVYAD